MKSSPPSDRAPALDLDLPTSPGDVEALRQARRHEAGRELDLDRLAPPVLFGPWPPRRTTAAGRLPFELD